MITHLAGDANHRFPSAAAQTQAAISPIQATSETFCPRQVDHEPLVDHKSIHLRDGTIVELNADACIKVNFSAKKRLVELESGEAIFRVAPDARRPYVVKTGPIDIRVLGTTFDVYRKESSTRVSVNEGAVQISSGDTTSRPDIKPLTVLQQIDVPDDTAKPRVRRSITPADFKRMTAWVHGEIELKELPLKEALEEFGRYRHPHVNINFSDARIGELRFSGLFQTNNLADFLELLRLKCIHSDYNPEQQQITLTLAPAQQGTACPKL